MSRSEPSYDEALENYYYYKNRYEDSAVERQSYYRQACNYENEKTIVLNKITQACDEKANLEKRRAGVEQIVRILESGSVPKAISDVNNSLTKAQESFSKSIRLSGGGQGCDLQAAFRTKGVSEDPNTSFALSEYKKEIERIVNEIQHLNQTISLLNAQVDTLNSKIRNCEDMQNSLRHKMNESAYEMDYYKQFID